MNNDLHTFEPLETAPQTGDATNADETGGGESGSSPCLPYLLAAAFMLLWWAAMIAEAFTG